MKLYSTLRASAFALVCVGAAASCEPRRFDFTLQFDRVFPFTVNSSESLIAMSTLTRAGILGNLDIPENATVTGVQIQSVSLSLSPQAANTTNTANVGLSYSTDGGPLQAFAGTILVNLADIVPYPLNDLVANAVASIRSDVEAMLIDGPGAPNQISVAASVGSRSPSGSLMLANGVVNIKLTVQYNVCEEIPVALGIGPDLPECVQN
jgi:hypothetical protein